MTRRPVVLIVNPSAGGKPASGDELADDPARLAPAELREALGARGLEVRLHELSEQDDPAAVAADAAGSGADVVAAGGDGTVGPVASGVLAHPGTTLGIIPTGSFNNVARACGVPLELEPALAAIGDGSSRPIDVGWVVDRDGGRPFFEAVGVGIDAIGFVTLELAERSGWRRAWRSMWRAFWRAGAPITVTIDGESHTTDAPAVVAMNGPYHGLGFAIAPEADAADGLLDVAIFRRMGRLEIVRYFLSVARRRHRHEPRIEIRRGRRVTIDVAGPRQLAHADGASIGATPVSLEVRPGALRVFVPADQP